MVLRAFCLKCSCCRGLYAAYKSIQAHTSARFNICFCTHFVPQILQVRTFCRTSKKIAKMVLFALVFNRKNSVNRDGKALVQIRAYASGKSRFFSTGIYIEPRHWARRLSKIVDCPNAPQLNAELRRQMNEWEAFALKMQQKRGFVSLEMLDNLQDNPASSFTEFCAAELECAAIANNTRRTRKNTLKLLSSFKNVVGFDELTYTFITRFDAFLRTRGLCTNTIAKHHQILRTLIISAVKKEMLETNPYQHFIIKQQQTTRDVLSGNEIERLEQLHLIGTIAQVRDMFLFACYTGLRFSDLIAITPAAMGEGADGLELKITAQKTKKEITLPLQLLHSGKPADIALFYAKTTRRKTIFEPITNQAANRLLKQLAKQIGSRKTLTMHTARHTFATHLANKVPVPILQQLLQHSDIKTTMRYVHESNTLVKNELKKVNW